MLELLGAKPTSIPVPSIRMTPLDEASDNAKILSMAFPTLYPWGKANLNTPRIQSVSILDYVEQLLRPQEQTCAIHPRWPFLVFNMIVASN